MVVRGRLKPFDGQNGPKTAQNLHFWAIALSYFVSPLVEKIGSLILCEIWRSSPTYTIEILVYT